MEEGDRVMSEEWVGKRKGRKRKGAEKEGEGIRDRKGEWTERREYVFVIILTWVSILKNSLIYYLITFES